MTAEELTICRALGRVTFLPGTPAKRNCRALAEAVYREPSRELTDRSRDMMYNYAIRYRRQIPEDVLQLIPEERFKTYEEYKDKKRKSK